MQVRSRDGRLSSRTLVLWLTAVAAGAGCGTSAGSGATTGEGGSSSASGGRVGTGGSSPAADAAVASGGSIGAGAGGASTGAGGTTGFGGASSGGAGVGAGFGGGNGTGGALGAGGSTGSGGFTAAGGAGGAAASASGGSKGVGGATGSGAAGTSGKGGATASGGGTGAGGTTGKGGATASGGAGGVGTGYGGSVASSFCPANAIFCADFEETSGVPVNHPVGTATFQDPTESAATFGAEGVMFLDTSSPYEGTQSLAVTPSSTAESRTLAISVPSTFWVRLYIKSDQAIGQTNENAFFGAGTSPTYRTGNYVVLAEQLGCLFLDKNGTLDPVDQTCGVNTPLAANVWHCIMAEFDGATGNVQVFSGTTQIINATGWAPAKEAFNTFEFGIFADNPNGATVWYDDVAISSSPLTCP